MLNQKTVNVLTHVILPGTERSLSLLDSAKSAFWLAVVSFKTLLHSGSVVVRQLHLCLLLQTIIIGHIGLPNYLICLLVQVSFPTFVLLMRHRIKALISDPIS